MISYSIVTSVPKRSRNASNVIELLITGGSNFLVTNIIIIRTKNEEQWISKCLEAVFDQTYNNIEENIVDNGDITKNLEVSFALIYTIPVILSPSLEFIPVKPSFESELAWTSATTLIAPTVSEINKVISERKPCSFV